MGTQAPSNMQTLKQELDNASNIVARAVARLSEAAVAPGIDQYRSGGALDLAARMMAVASSLKSESLMIEETTGTSPLTGG